MNPKIIVAVHSFGYKSFKDVNTQFNRCMFNGELYMVCKVLCWQDAPDGHHSDENEGLLENKCDQCRGQFKTLDFIICVIGHFPMIKHSDVGDDVMLVTL